MSATCEVRFQTVAAGRRADYVAMYKQAIQEIKQAGGKGGLILCSEDDPESVLVLLEWESKEHYQRWRGTLPHARFHGAVEGWQTKPSTGAILSRRNHLDRVSCQTRNLGAFFCL